MVHEWSVVSKWMQVGYNLHTFLSHSLYPRFIEPITDRTWTLSSTALAACLFRPASCDFFVGGNEWWSGSLGDVLHVDCLWAIYWAYMVLQSTNVSHLANLEDHSSTGSYVFKYTLFIHIYNELQRYIIYLSISIYRYTVDIYIYIFIYRMRSGCLTQPM